MIKKQDEGCYALKKTARNARRYSLILYMLIVNPISIVLIVTSLHYGHTELSFIGLLLISLQ